MDNEYLGFKELVVTGEEVNDLFNPESENTFGCLKNEYLIASDENGNNIGMFKCNGHRVEKIPYKAIDTRFAGKVKARNPQQEFAIDMLYDEDTTVKIIAGKFGTGKDFLMCSAAIDLLEHDKFEKIVYVRNNIEVKNSKPIGHLPGSYNEKLLPFAMPLADHLGGVDGLELMIGHGKIEIVHLGFIRGRDIKNSIIICSEAENRNGSSIERKILTIVDGVNEEVIQENSNKNPTILSTQRDYMAGEVSREITNNTLLPKDILNAHEKGLIHFHDSDYFVQRMPNCCLVNIEDMLQNGTVISDTLIEKPHSFSTACNVTTQAVAQIASNQYGGQSISLTHLAPFVDVSRQKIRKDVEEEIAACNGDINSIDSIVEKRLRDEIKRGVQTIQYQVLTLMTTNGQTPFITVFMYLGEAKDERTKEDLAMIIEEVVRQRIQGVKNENGAWITPAFPKLIYVLEEDNIHEDSKYWYLTKLCAECSVKRLVPDYISEKMMLQNKVDVNGDGHCYPCMGCRSFLTPYLDEGGNPKYYGRFNQGVVTINLPDVGLSAVKQMEGITYIDDEQYQKRKEEIFWTIFEERLELCHRALRLRHERLLGTLSDASPIHWQNGGLARLKKGETIDKLLYGGYSTLSLGYAGLYECVKAMTGKSHTDDEAKPFALAIMQKMNDKCAEWKAAENIDYSLYGTPIESTTYKFAKCLQSRFGVIEGITDKNYITNSYHVHVTEKINAFDKLRFESEFQQLSPGGAISYIETANLSDNVEAALSVIKYIYYHIMYAELNTKSDFCQECGYDGEIQIVENDDGKLIWKCPNCGNTNRTKMNIARRTCGYIGVNDFNQGRTQEIKERYVHLGGE